MTTIGPRHTAILLAVTAAITGCGNASRLDTAGTTDTNERANFVDGTVHLRALAIDIEARPDDTFQACVVSVAGTQPDHRLCTGNVSGDPGDSWGRADRIGTDVIVTIIHASRDQIVDNRFDTTLSGDYPVAVSGGVLHDYPSEMVCTTYRYDGNDHKSIIGITTDEQTPRSPTGCPPASQDTAAATRYPKAMQSLMATQNLTNRASAPGQRSCHPDESCGVSRLRIQTNSATIATGQRCMPQRSPHLDSGAQCQVHPGGCWTRPLFRCTCWLRSVRTWCRPTPCGTVVSDAITNPLIVASRAVAPACCRGTLGLICVRSVPA